MKYKHLILLVAMLFLIGVSTASPVYLTQGMGETDKGLDGVLVPLGIPIQFHYVYNWISLGFIFLIAATASQKNGMFFAILLPVFASMFVWFGWLSLNTENAQAKEIGIIIMCGVLAVGLYFKGKQQQSFGISGPGSPFLNIVFWMIMLQASIGFINASGLFDSGTGSAITPTYPNIDLQTNVPSYASTGGFFAGITDQLYLLTTAVISAWTMIWKVLAGIVYFKSLVISIAPFLANNAIVDLFLTVISAAIDFVVLLAVWIWIFKPPLGEAI